MDLNQLSFQELKEFLDFKAEEFQNPSFIGEDPISIPHRYSLLQDIEIAGFLSASIAWGNRKAILGSAHKIMDLMGNNPYDFVRSYEKRHLKSIEGKAVHRTFSAHDLDRFLSSLKRLYEQEESLEHYFLIEESEEDYYHALERFRISFIEDPKDRSAKHVSSTYKNSAAKRLMMFLRWMVRPSDRGVDFGVWKNLKKEYLSIPLDVHTGNVARALELVERKQNDWKTVKELDHRLRKMDPLDPAKYDFALFGLGQSREIVLPK